MVFSCCLKTKIQTKALVIVLCHNTKTHLERTRESLEGREEQEHKAWVLGWLEHQESFQTSKVRG